MTDEGFNLTNQWLIINGNEGYTYGMRWLSDLAGGIWLKIVGDLGLIGARLGWALTMGLTGLVSFLILKRYFHPLASLLAVLAVALASMYHGTMTINYNNFPALLLIGATGLLLVSQERGASRHHQTWFAILGGCLLGVGVMARFPLVLSLFLPFVPPIARVLLARRMPLKPYWTKALISIVSALFTILVCLGLLHLTNYLAEYLGALKSALTEPTDSAYNISYLLHLYYETGKSAIIWGGKFVASGFVIALGIGAVFCLMQSLIRKHFGRFQAKWHWIAAILFGFLFFGLVHYQAGGRYDYSLALPGICFVLAALQLLLGILNSRSFTTQQMSRFVLLTMGLSIALLKILGSANGIPSANGAIWLLFPTAFLLLPELIEVISSRFPRIKAGDKRIRKVSGKKARNKTSNRVSAQKARIFVIAAMFALAVVALSIRVENPYRDLTNRFQLTTQLEHKRLRGIFTSSGRAESVNQLLDELDELVTPRDVMLAYNNIPMIHYVTQTVPALGHPWPTTMMTEELKAKLDHLSSRGIPSVVVLSKTNTRNRTWGTREISRFGRSQMEKIRIGVEWIKKHQYRAVWSNRDFAIYTLLPEASSRSGIIESGRLGVSQGMMLSTHGKIVSTFVAPAYLDPSA